MGVFLPPPPPPPPPPPIDGDLFEDGLQMKNGFFRTRRYAKAGSEQGSVDLFAEERGEESEGEAEAVGSQAEALRRKDRLEREEFIKKCRVGLQESFCSKVTAPCSPSLPQYLT